MGCTSFIPLAFCQLSISPKWPDMNLPSQGQTVIISQQTRSWGVSVPFHVGSTAHDVKVTGSSPEEGTAQAFHSHGELKAKFHKDVAQ